MATYTVRRGRKIITRVLVADKEDLSFLAGWQAGWSVKVESDPRHVASSCF